MKPQRCTHSSFSSVRVPPGPDQASNTTSFSLILDGRRASADGSWAPPRPSQAGLSTHGIPQRTLSGSALGHSQLSMMTGIAALPSLHLISTSSAEQCFSLCYGLSFWLTPSSWQKLKIYALCSLQGTVHLTLNFISQTWKRRTSRY